MTYQPLFWKKEHPDYDLLAQERDARDFRELLPLVAELNLSNASTIAGTMVELIELRGQHPDCLAAVAYRKLPPENFGDPRRDFRYDFLRLLIRLWKAPRRDRQDIVAAMVFLAQANNTTIKEVAASFS